MVVDLDVLLPFHRHDKYLEEAVTSINSSKSISFRLIAIDDRPDQSKSLSRLFATVKNLTYLSTEGGQGYGRALEVGSSALNSSHTALFNSDDLLDPYRFKKQLEALSYSELNLTSIKRIDSRGRETASYAGSTRANRYNPLFLLFGAYGANATWCMHREWWQKNAFFDPLESLDWRIAMTSFQNTKLSYLSEPLYFYRKHPTQITANKNPDFDSITPVFEIWREFANTFPFLNNTRNVFNTVATPWILQKKGEYSEISKWIDQVNAYSSQFDSEVSKDLKRIVQRRFIAAALRTQEISFSGRLAYGIKGSPEIFSLSKELLL
jgi:hypothetical protein